MWVAVRFESGDEKEGEFWKILLDVLCQLSRTGELRILSVG